MAFLSLPLLGSALAVGAAALPAGAATWHDTSLLVNGLHATTANPAAPSVVPTSGPTNVISVIPAPSGGKLTVNFSASNLPSGVTVVKTPAGVVKLTGSKFISATALIPGTLVVNDTSASGGVLAEIVRFSLSPATGLVTPGAHYTDAPTAITRSYVVGGVQFREVPTITRSPLTAPALVPAPVYKFAYSGLPGGIVSNSAGRLTIAGSTAAPGTYGGAGVRAADQYGARTQSAFQLVVYAHPVYVPGNYGDEVNPFGNGFDVYQQHQAVNAIIVGWTATKADPATHFLRLPGYLHGAIRFEYAPYGAGTGLFVADPGYDAAGTGLKDGLVLRAGNSGAWQQWYPLANGTLKNAATGLIISPNGTGAQLRGTTAPTGWGGSHYTWIDYAHLPG